MAREIKFRGKTNNGNWLVGEILSLNKHKYIAPNDGDWFDFIEWVPENVFHAPDSDKYEVEENTIGQFTGLHDKKGKEIYEGDILHVIAETDDTHDYITQVSTNGLYEVDLVGCEYDFTTLAWLSASYDECCTIEVIGNIYDNPELLKEE